MTRSRPELQADYPLLAKVLDGFYDGTSEDYLDGVEVLDVGLHALALDPRLSSGVTQAVVAMARVPEGVVVQTSYPDLPLDPEWASRLPDLAHVYGAWFGQDRDEDDRTVDDTFALVAARLNEPARSRVVAQLGQLMTLPEPDVRTAPHALGSYALPERADAWVERLHWALSSWPAAVPVDAPPDSLDV